MRRLITSLIAPGPLLGIAASIVALALPGALLAEDASTISPGTYVRVSTRTEELGESLEPTADTTNGKPLAHDHLTMTFATKGQPVRVARPGVTLKGTLQAVDQNTLTLQQDGGAPIVVPRASIRSVDLRQRESKRGLGVLVGVLAGGAIGYAVGAATSGPGCHGGETGLAHLCTLDEIDKPAGAVLGVLGGVILGALVAPGDKWDNNVSLDHVRLSFGPTRGRGAGFSLAVGF